MTRARALPALLALAALLAGCSSKSSAGAAASVTSTAMTSTTSAAPATTTETTTTATTDTASSTPMTESSAAVPTDPPTALPSVIGGGTCKLSAGAIKAIVGFDVTNSSVNQSGPVTLCLFAGTAGGTVLVRAETGIDAVTFAAGLKAFEAAGQVTKPLSGVGDEAFSGSLGAGDAVTSTVIARKGGADVIVAYSGPKSSVDVASKLVLAAFDAFGI